ncbi:MAG: DUF411 domain-containing protein [Alphaproteobacteria bacterium]
MRALITALVVALAPAFAPAADAATQVTLYKDPLCGCCAAYADYLRDHGFAVTVIETEEIDAAHARAGTPEGFEGCHLTMIEGYAVEGHVPVGAIAKLLAERPAIVGLSVPGMPEGSPGMGGVADGPLTVYRFGATDGGDPAPAPYAVE